MNETPRPLLLSLRPRYADLVFEGLKKAELRRRSLGQVEGGEVFIYVTSPVRELRGGFRVGEVWAGTPEEIWEQVSEQAGINRDDFDAYYEGRSEAYALEVTGVWEYVSPPRLSALKRQFDNFVVPQSWRYVKPEEHESFLSRERAIETEDCDWPPVTSTPHEHHQPQATRRGRLRPHRSALC